MLLTPANFNYSAQPLAFTFQPGAVSVPSTIQLGGGGVAYVFPKQVTNVGVAHLTAVSGNGQVSLTWSVVSGATGYNVYQSDSSNGPYLKMNTAPVTGTGYVDTALANRTHYYYYVTAVNAVGESYQP